MTSDAREYAEKHLDRVHPEMLCAGRPCVIHNPTDHHMRDWPVNWRNDRCLFERICPCGIGHPDPDSLHADKLVHGCCGHCCE